MPDPAEKNLTHCAHRMISCWRVEPIEAMLGPVELTMNLLPQFPSFVPRIRLRRMLPLSMRRIAACALLACAGSIPPLHAQNAALVSPQAQKAPESLPTAPSASAANPDVAVSAFASYQRQARFAALPGSSFDPGNRSFINPFQTLAKFGGPSGAPASAMRFDGTCSFGSGRQATSGFNQFNSFSMGVRQGPPGTLFSSSSMTGGPFGTTPQPSLNQLMRGAFNLPLNSSSSSALRFQYSGILMPAGSLSDLARPYSSVLFTSSDLGNGMFLSAGTYNSGHSMAGAPTLPAGNGSGAPKRPASGVAIKLSF
jgi:hypothetical protein